MAANGIKLNRFNVLGAIAAAVTTVGLSVTAVLAQASGEIRIDGSSTVYPITEAMAEEFMAINPNVRITVGVSGTGGGFSKFCNGETEISNASRPIKESEIEACRANGIEYIELPVAYDALTVVVNSQNNWATSMTIEELSAIWSPDSTVSSWSQVRSGWPDAPIALYGPGTDSGTFDYFTEAVNGESGASRSDFTASEDDNVLVQGVAGDRNALGYFGFSYYEENQGRLRAVAIDNGSGPVAPEREAVETNTYTPLSRPLFIYVSQEAAERPEVSQFVGFYLSSPQLVDEVGYVRLPERAYSLALSNFEGGNTGSRFVGRETVGVSIEDLLELEAE
jgi:phosphate transport system substrate-binding protein